MWINVQFTLTMMSFANADESSKSSEELKFNLWRSDQVFHLSLVYIETAKMPLQLNLDSYFLHLQLCSLGQFISAFYFLWWFNVFTLDYGFKFNMFLLCYKFKTQTQFLFLKADRWKRNKIRKRNYLPNCVGRERQAVYMLKNHKRIKNTFFFKSMWL